MTKHQMVVAIRRLHRGMPGYPDPMDGWWGWREQPEWCGLWPAWLVALWWRRADLGAVLDNLTRGGVVR